MSPPCDSLKFSVIVKAHFKMFAHVMPTNQQWIQNNIVCRHDGDTQTFIFSIYQLRAVTDPSYVLRPVLCVNYKHESQSINSSLILRSLMHSSVKLDNLFFFLPLLPFIYPRTCRSLNPISAIHQGDVQRGGTAGEVEGSVSTHGSAGDAAVAGQFWLRHRLDGVFCPGLQFSGRGKTLYEARYINANTTLYLFEATHSWRS